MVPTESFSLQEILDQFTGDPIIDVERKIISFIYKEGSVAGAHSEIITKTKKAPDLVKKLTANKAIGTVSIDLGQTHPQTSRFDLVKMDGGKIITEYKGEEFLPQSFLKQILSYRKRTDQLNSELEKSAIESLTLESRSEYERVFTENKPKLVGNRIVEKFGIDFWSLPLDKMSSNTTLIADAYSATGKDASLVMFTPTPKKKAKKLVQPSPVKQKDFAIVKDMKLKVSEAVRRELNDKLWELKRTSVGYKKLAKSKEQLARSIVNYTIRRARDLTGCDTIVPIIEDLNVDNRIFSGSGKRELGYTHFFESKKENRWFIQVLHKAYSDLSMQKGINVVEVRPSHTSTTCPNCWHRNVDNRSGDQFKCLKCSWVANTDLQIAPYWLIWEALNGRFVPEESEREGWGGVEIPVSAREPQKSNDSVILTKLSDASPVYDGVAHGMLEISARKLGSNAA
jgi:Putative transposase DNA-binding domain